ncbi:terpene synthase family protein [Amycolatopsis sp. cg5]|uniref:terpene synthase family protein n=1 Tax=Amycolatopsis sp. cg5 TaxID=3238802 RepID=UPI003526205B
MEHSELAVLRLPSVELPFLRQQNPSANQVADRTRAWADRAHLLSDRHIRATMTGDAWLHFAAYMYPFAHPDRLAAINALDLVMFLDDDQADHASVITDSLLDLMLTGLATGELAELLPTLDRGMSPGWSARLRADLAAWADSNREAAARHATGPLPVADYITWRRISGTLWWHFDLIEYAHERELPPGFRETAQHQDLVEAAADIVCWTNDLHSARKELARNDPNNLLAVLVAHRQMTVQEAADECAAWIAERTRSFVALRGALPRELAWFGDALAAWCQGNLDFCRASGRYT